MKHIITFKEFINESINEAASPSEIKKVEDFLKKNGKYEKGEDLYKWSDGTLDFDVTLGLEFVKLYDGEENTIVPYKKFIQDWMNESIDTKYWLDYNKDTSGQMPPEHLKMSKNFEDEFEDAVSNWQSEADERLTSAQIKKARAVAEEFFKKEKQISVAIIQAMIAQES